MRVRKSRSFMLCPLQPDCLHRSGTWVKGVSRKRVGVSREPQEVQAEVSWSGGHPGRRYQSADGLTLAGVSGCDHQLQSEAASVFSTDDLEVMPRRAAGEGGFVSDLQTSASLLLDGCKFLRADGGLARIRTRDQPVMSRPLCR